MLDADGLLHFSLRLGRCLAGEPSARRVRLCYLFPFRHTWASQHIPSPAVDVIRCLNQTKLYTRLNDVLLYSAVYNDIFQLEVHVKNVLIIY